MKQVLVITGSARNVMDDLMAMPCRTNDFMAIGLDAVDKYPWPILYVATFHPDEIGQIRERRESICGNTDYKVIGHKRRDNVDIAVLDWWRPSGSSALLGVQAALTVLGYERIILCGCPLNGKSDKGNNYENFRKGWTSRLAELGGRVRSMSGWTMELLGPPAEDWLNG